MSRTFFSVISTQIAGADRLWRELPEAMRASVELLVEQLEDALEAHDGEALRCEDGGYVAAFEAPLEALRWCMEVQRALLELEWPDALLDHGDGEEIRADGGRLLYRGLRVKMGVDLGKVFERREPFSGAICHHGRTIRRATALSSFAGAGQTVVSVGVHHYIGAEAWAEFEPSVLELHEFCAQTRLSESGFVVLPAELDGRRNFSVSDEPLRRSNLPSFHTNFVDRSVELARLAENLGEGCRWITLVGPAGAGKTRLAVEFGSQWLEERAGVAAEAWFCDLTAARDVGSALATIARAVEVQLPASDDPTRAAAALEQALSGRGELLLVLDNVEQLAGQDSQFAEMIAGWMGAGSSVQIVATSRRSFDHDEECVQTVDSMGEDAALALLVDRLFQARGAQVSFDERDHEALREIAAQCARLPLAIELVAAGGKLLSPAELLQAWSKEASGRSGSRLDLAIERSWRLLKQWERRAVAQCAAFEGGFTVEAAEQVLNLDDPNAPPVIEVLEALHGQSLLRSPPGTESATRARLSLYEPVRDFVRLRQSADELEAAARRHAEYYCEWGRDQIAKLDTEVELEVVRRMTEELANLQQAFRHSVAGRPEQAVQLVAALSELDRRIGPLSGQLERVQKAVELAESLDDARLQITALDARARARQWLHQHDQAFADYERGLELAQSQQAQSQQAQSQQEDLQVEPLIGLAAVTHRLGRHADTETYVRRALELVEGTTTTHEVTVLQQLGVLHSWRGERDEAVRYLNEAQICARRIGNPSALAEALALYGPAITAHFQYDEAERAMEEALEIFSALGNRRKMVVITFQLAFVYVKTDRPELAERAYSRALEIIESAGLSKSDRGAVLRGRGEARFWRGRYAQAEADLTEALSLIDAGSVVRTLYARLYLAASLALLDRRAESREHFERAAEQLQETDLPTERALARTLEGYLKAAEARGAHAREETTGALALLQKAYSSVEAGEHSSHTAVQDEAERLRAYLDALVEAGEAPQLDALDEPDLLVAADTRWLCVKGQERVDISRRGSIKRILHELVERRLTAPGEPLSLDETLEAGWPGDVVMPEAGARRVYTTINRLRDLGLTDIVVTTDDGYMLDPSVLVRRESQ